MGPTVRWLNVSTTITRIWAGTGRLLNAKDVMALGRQQGGLRVESTHEHVRVSEASVDAYVARYGRRRTAVPVGEGPDIGHEAELDFERSKRDYDNTPNDEGDNEQ
ncbi:hypothetical protein ACIBQX_11765 [Nonomuraea sp. NPDC049714]|uniref:hypothetical protein n=1 Tax=Nonomuraea sp. NPDC049714 TaxID=3364357 RepID=UPI0037935208